MRQPPSGIINIRKEAGWTSFDVVAKLRRILQVRKIGHTGTLDPMATGVLPVCIKKATGVVPLLTDAGKCYEAVLLLGKTTDTQDTTGTTLRERTVDVSEGMLREAVGAFIGKQKQLPPMYSAKKVQGKRLYELAREGKEIGRKTVPIEIFSIELLWYISPRAGLRIRCSKGTYIRTLLHDIGERLGCGGCMEELVRTQVGPFLLEEALTLTEIAARWERGEEDFIIPVDALFSELPGRSIDASYTKLLENGNPLPKEALILREDAIKTPISGLRDIGMPDVGLSGALGNDASGRRERLRIYHPDGRFAGIYTLEGQRARPVKIFLE